jgi:ABC-2 type transport system ATP-binding protein
VPEGALVLDGVVKRYGAVTAVDGLSLAVRRGEILGLLGPNGAGKTTTVGLVSGLLEPDGGRVLVAGRPPSSPESRRRLGVAPQALALYDALTGRENLEFFASLHGLAGAARDERVRSALDFVGLAERAGDRAATYSGGMKRRLNLAAALVHDPEIVVLDEPTVGVDPQSRNAIFDNVEQLNREGMTVIYTTHYMEEAERLCDRVAIVDRGRLLALDTVDGLLAGHGAGSVLVVRTEEDVESRLETADPVGELARLHATGRVRAFRLERPRLEDVFLHLTGRRLRD